jgi:hypothetical protein
MTKSTKADRRVLVTGGGGFLGSNLCDKNSSRVPTPDYRSASIISLDRLVAERQPHHRSALAFDRLRHPRAGCPQAGSLQTSSKCLRGNGRFRAPRSERAANAFRAEGIPGARAPREVNSERFAIVNLSVGPDRFCRTSDGAWAEAAIERKGSGDTGLVQCRLCRGASLLWCAP